MYHIFIWHYEYKQKIRRIGKLHLSFCLEREQIAGDTDGDEPQQEFHPAGGKQEEDAMQTGNPQ